MGHAKLRGTYEERREIARRRRAEQLEAWKRERDKESDKARVRQRASAVKMVAATAAPMGFVGGRRP